MDWFRRLYLGTWQFGGQFKRMSFTEIKSLLDFALDSGISRFDTAVVYGGGRVEEVLGRCLPKDVAIITKVPAITRPQIGSLEPIHSFYSPDHIYRSVHGSLRRLRRSTLDTVLLHNWLPTWSPDATSVFRCLARLKELGLAKRVGISLPDGFPDLLDQKTLSFVDVVEAPFNPGEQWVLRQLPALLDLNKEVVLRSLFAQGKLLRAYSRHQLLKDALELQTSVAIGMTTEEQITLNISQLREGGSSDTTVQID